MREFWCRQRFRFFCRRRYIKSIARQMSSGESNSVTGVDLKECIRRVKRGDVKETRRKFFGGVALVIRCVMSKVS